MQIDNLMTNDDAIEDELRSTFTSIYAPASVRERVLMIVASSNVQQEQPKRFWLAGRPGFMRAGLYGVVLVILIAVGLLLQREPNHAFDVASAAERLVSVPDAGQGRHIIATVYQRSSQQGGERTWVTEIWERTSSDGVWERTIEARDLDGTVIGRLVQTETTWALLYRDGVATGDGEPTWLPDELNVTRLSLDQIRTNLIAADADHIRIAENEGQQLIDVDLLPDFDAASLASLSNAIDDDVVGVHRRVVLDDHSERLLSISFVAETAHSGTVVVSSSDVQTWDELPSEQLASDVFAMPTAAASATCSRVMIEAALPANWQVTNQYCEDGTWDHIILSSADGMPLELTISPRSNTVVTAPRAAQHVTTSVGEVAWVGHPDGGDPASAVWSDAESWYSISVLAAPRWTLDDLVDLVEAITSTP